MELNPIEVTRSAIQTAQNVGHFVTDRLVGGAWAKLAEQVYSDQDHQNTIDHIKSVAGSE